MMIFLRAVYGEMEGGVTVCDNPKEYLWWDEYHPTTIAHSKMAGAAVLALKTKGWLE
jgi:phospholipase/lecithinase/hemolysin